ncbi:MAG: DUF2958 domain-containing protein [Prevotella sp.]|nr:DUF2958 domain-containing protein [Candidatus Prevotella equi]
MKLITKTIEKQIAKYPLYSQDGVKDKKVIVKFFFGAYTWYVTEGQKQENGDYLFYGYTENQYGRELGYFTLSDLQSVKRWGYPCVERDMYFKPCLMSKVA